jgi:hypothetical protein
VEGREPPPVEQQQPLSLGADRHPAGAQHQDRCDRSQARFRRQDLAKTRAIEGQHSLPARAMNN